VGSASSSISLGGLGLISGLCGAGGSQPIVVSLVKKSGLSLSSLLSVLLVTLGLGDWGLGGAGDDVWVVAMGEICVGEEWCRVGTRDLGGRGDRFRRTQIEPELPDRRFFARRRQSGFDACERCDDCEVNRLRQPGHF